MKFACGRPYNTIERKRTLSAISSIHCLVRLACPSLQFRRLLAQAEYIIKRVRATDEGITPKPLGQYLSRLSRGLRPSCLTKYNASLSVRVYRKRIGAVVVPWRSDRRKALRFGNRTSVSSLRCR